LFNLELLEKNRHKRPSLEEVLNHPWFSNYKDIHELRVNHATNNESKFSSYTLTEPNSPKIKEEIEKYSKE
jgi:serine/threonine protein kinase